MVCLEILYGFKDLQVVVCVYAVSHGVAWYVQAKLVLPVA